MNLPHPASPEMPKYWRYERGGLLGPAIERYLLDRPLSKDDVLLIRAYLRQWIDSPLWDMNPSADDGQRRELAQLRAKAKLINTRKDITGWLHDALNLGIDPL